MSMVAAVPGLTYVPDYLGVVEREELLTEIDREIWSDDLRRRVQHYGYRYNYRRRAVDEEAYLGPLPGWAVPLVERLWRDGHACQGLDQLIVNEYLPGQGISAHIDCVPCFAGTILSLSLGSSCVMTMSRPAGHGQPAAEVPLLLEPGGLLVMQGDARYVWRHGIAARKTDTYGHRRIVRNRRVSLTFRRVIRSG